MKTNFITHGNQNFPIISTNALPDWAKNFIKESQKSINCPEEYLTTLFLSLCSICIGNSTKIQVKNNWSERPALYTIIIGKPSMKKSPAMNEIFKPLEKIQNDLAIKNWKAFEKYQEELKIRKKNKNESNESGKPLTIPKEKLVYLTDTTMEALTDVLNANPLGVILKKDEINHFLSSLNAYKSGGGDLETVLELYNGQSSSVARRNRERTLQTFKPFFSIAGGIQFKPFKDFFTNKENGIIERFNFCMPKAGIDTKHSRYDVDLKTIKAYTENVIEIFKISHEMAEQKSEMVCRLSPEAYDLWEDWCNTMPENEELDSMFEKAKARALRIALILHVLKNPERKMNIIDEVTCRDALLITNYFVNSHILILHQLEHKEMEDKCDHAFNWFIRQYSIGGKLHFCGLARGIKIREFYNNNSSKYKDANEAYEVINRLVEKGYGRIAEPPKNAHKNIPTIFVMYPQILKEYGIVLPSLTD